MARQLRVEYNNAFYHITSRGNERKEIFRDDGDKDMFLNYVRQAHDRFKMIIHTFCLMNNHYHLLAETLCEFVPNNAFHNKLYDVLQ